MEPLFVTADIPRFWAAYDRARPLPTEQWAKIFETDYLQHPERTVGLKDFIFFRRVTPQRLADYVAKRPRFFESLRDESLKLERQASAVEKAVRGLTRHFPEAKLPKTYLCMGPFAGGGTASGAGLLLSAEMCCLHRGLVKDELTAWESSVVMKPEELPPLCAHETVHFQQRFPWGDRSLLKACLQEGSADFVGKLACGKMLKRTEELHRWGNAHERQLWEEFQREMDGTETGRWLYSGSEQGDRPVDTGYYMGFKITEAYWKRQRDKVQALRAIFTITDPRAFLSASGYAEAFR